MFSNGVLVFISAVLIFTATVTQGAVENQSATTDKNDIFYLCKRDKNIRWLRAYKLENGKCKSLYSKEGYLQVISSATYFSSCEGVMLSVKKNIEEGGFKCVLAPKVSVIDLEAE